jgi:thioredoxin reductase
VIRGADLSKSMSSYLSLRAEATKNIEILCHTEIRKMTGDKHLETVELENIENPRAAHRADARHFFHDRRQAAR